MTKLTIQVFTTKEGNSNWILLPEASAYLTDRQLILNTGDAITLPGADGQLLGIDKGDFKHIQTVKRKWVNYATADVALLVGYEAW